MMTFQQPGSVPPDDDNPYRFITQEMIGTAAGRPTASEVRNIYFTPPERHPVRRWLVGIGTILILVWALGTVYAAWGWWGVAAQITLTAAIVGVIWRDRL